MILISSLKTALPIVSGEKFKLDNESETCIVLPLTLT